MNPAKLDQKKAPKIRREKETRGKDQSPAKQTAQKRWGHKEVREPLSSETFTSHNKHINQSKGS
jgi:hypothetical protein